MRTHKVGLISILILGLMTTAFSQTVNDSLILEKIKAAATTHSSISPTITQFADINGPRLLGTINYYKSAQWIKQQLRTFGVDSAYFQSFDQQLRAGQSARLMSK